MFLHVYCTYIKGIENLLYIASLKDFREGTSKGTSYIGLEHFPTFIYKRKFLLSTVIVIFSFLYCLFLLFWILKSLMSLVIERKKTLSGDRILLATSMAMIRVVKNAGLYREDDVLLYGAWVKRPLSLPNPKLTVFNLVSVSDVFKNALYSLYIFYRVIYRYGIKCIPEVIGIYKWLLYYSAVTKISKEKDILFCNHMDPYALLIDAIPNDRKILIQHGTLIIMHNPQSIPFPYYTYIKEDKIWTLNPPHKLKNVSFVYAFTEQEYQVLTASILGTNPSYKTVGYSLKLSNRIGNKPISVLLIGYYPFYFKLEESVIRELQDNQIDVFVKNHPTVDISVYNNLKEKYNFSIIEGSLFPLVDVVISYDSTLALEYKSVGIKVLFYSEFEIAKINNIVKNIISENSTAS